MSNNKHSDSAISFCDGDLKNLAQEVENMKYDCIAEFLEHLSDTIYERACGDIFDDKRKLHSQLIQVSFALNQAVKHMNNAWDICNLSKEND